MYERVWSDLSTFCQQYLSKQLKIPVSISTLALYLAYLNNKGYAGSTISSYNSAVGYYHKLENVADPSTSFFISNLIQGIKKQKPSIDSRLPITLPILHKLVDAVDKVCIHPFYKALYKAMYLVAFHAFLRVGEMTSDVANNDNHCLQYRDVVVDKQGCVINFQSYKHSVPGTITQFDIQRQGGHICPVYQLESYYRVRGNVMGPVFINIDGSLVGRDQFVRMLQKTLSHIGLSGDCYKSHSFRIGACCHAMEQGKSETQIRLLGRWHSNAFLRYIRPDHVSL